MTPIQLPSVAAAARGHGADHAALKAEYDQRHPDAPLPELGGGLIGGRQSHEVIHELLAADYNALRGVDWLPTKLPSASAHDGGLIALHGSRTPGHLDAHNALHAAYNARMAATERAE